MKFSLLLFLASITCTICFGGTAKGYTFVNATVDKSGVLTAEFYENPPFEIDALNRHILEQVLVKDPSDVIDLHDGKIWEGPLRVLYTIEIEKDQIVSFKVDFKGLPRPTNMKDPTYPSKALSNGVEGYVTVDVTISQLGIVEDLKVVDSAPHGYHFERSVLKAVRKWEFEMPTVDGSPIPVKAQHRFEFMLKP